MDLILLLVGAVAAASYGLFRAHRVVDTAHALVGAAKHSRFALPRPKSKRKSSLHPADCIDDPVVAAGALAVAFLNLDDRPSREKEAALALGLSQEFALTPREVGELLVIGHWLSTECGGPAAAIPRIGKRLFRLDRGASFSRLLAVIKETTAAGTGLSPSQSRALDDLRKVYRIA